MSRSRSINIFYHAGGGLFFLLVISMLAWGLGAIAPEALRHFQSDSLRTGVIWTCLGLLCCVYLIVFFRILLAIMQDLSQLIWGGEDGVSSGP